MKAVRGFAAVKKLAAILFCTAVVSIAGQAQSAVRGTFHLREAVRWEKVVLPAGEYTLTIESAQRPMQAIVRTMDRKKAVTFLSTVAWDAQPGGCSLRVTRGEGSIPSVHLLNLPQLGSCLGLWNSRKR